MQLSQEQIDQVKNRNITAVTVDQYYEHIGDFEIVLVHYLNELDIQNLLSGKWIRKPKVIGKTPIDYRVSVFTKEDPENPLTFDFDFKIHL